MERMTFYIPPVFLFGNNANRFHNNEEEKSEYKTAAETEIKVENWRAKRIAELEEENKKLREELSKYKKYYDRDKEELMESCYSLARENDELKKQIENLNGIAKMLI